jgi:DNA-binding IclR family transcriptional regulator
VLLAALSPAELARRYIDRALPVRTVSSIGSWTELEHELACVRREGYAINREEGERGISAVATALRDLTGAPLGAVAVVVPAGRFDAEAAWQLTPALLAAGARLQEHLSAVRR